MKGEGREELPLPKSEGLFPSSFTVQQEKVRLQLVN